MKSALKLDVALPDVELIDNDGEPLETNWHRAAMNLLIEVLAWRFRDRTDFFVGGNMFIYYCEEQARTRRFRGPDLFYVDGVDSRPDRPYWAVWQEEGRYPDLIVELTSEKTAREDRTTKKSLYERTFRTPEYFCYDPRTEKLEGWRLGKQHRYQPIKPDKRGWMWSETLQLWLGTWQGRYLNLSVVWLRFFDAEGNLVPIRAEAQERRAAAAEEEPARLKAKLADRKKDVNGR